MPPRTIHLVETRPTKVSLTEEQARAVTLLGERLASKATWWGSNTEATADEAATVISCTPAGATTWNVSVSNAIGAFGIDDVTFVVVPKVSMAHVLYIMSRGMLLPRMAEAQLLIAKDSHLWELIARWFLDQTLKVISRDLIRDYQSVYDLVSAVRGQIDAVPSAINYYSGSLNMFCSYDEFTVDNAHNRVLMAALLALQRLTHLGSNLRREAGRLAGHFVGVGPLKYPDLEVFTDRRSAHYHDALILAKLILSATALAIAEGSLKAWTFLIRTPEAIEAGIRAILNAGLAPQMNVRKRRIALIPKDLGIDPDLYFDPVGFVGDVKYKLYGSDWPRSDLYQSVAFAAGAGTARSCVISFVDQKVAALPAVRFNGIEVSHLIWDACASSDPTQSGVQLAEDCRKWLNP